MLHSLLGARRFAALFWCQFFSAFNDNVLKTGLILLIAFDIGSQADGGDSGALIMLAGATFVVPFFFLSGLGGQMADRHDKAIVARRLKLFEIGAAAVAVAGFALQSIPVLFAALILFGVIAALFGPIKYGILPDLLQREELPPGNALIEGATFIAILAGTMFAGLVMDGDEALAAFGANLGLVGASGETVAAIVIAISVLAFAALCYLAARRIPLTGSGDPELVVDWNIVRSTAGLIRHAWSNSAIWRTGLMVAWFWALALVVTSLLPPLVRDSFGGSEQVVTAFNAVFAVGVAVGSAAAAWLANGRIILLPTPIAALIMAGFLIDLGFLAFGAPASTVELGIGAVFSDGRGIHAAIDLFGLSAAGGLFVVPAFSAIQAWSEPQHRARVIAGVNVIAAGFMVIGSLGTAALQNYGIGTPVLLLAAGALSAVAGVIILRFLPTSPVRDFLSILFRTFYRMEVRGTENFAKAGPTMIVALNHVSFLDAALALAVLDRDPVFAVDQWIARQWWVRPWLRFARAIPLDPQHPMSTRTLIATVRNGESIAIFPEGRLTATGSLMKVYDGAGLIADKSGVMVVPVRIDGLEQTPFTRLDPTQVKRRWWPKVSVTVLEPVRLTVPPELRGKARRAAAGAALYQVMSDLVFRTTMTDCTVVEALVDAARRHGFNHPIIEDPTAELTYKKLLAGVAVLGAKLAPLAPVGGGVGVMLPNSIGATVATLGLMSAARVPAMVNFTAGAANILAACKAADLKTIVTSRLFVEKGHLNDLVATLAESVSIVYLEDVRKTVSIVDKLVGLYRSRRPLVERNPDDAAAILFTSGSEGTPKGVVISHRNILANAAQGAARVEFGRTDKVFNVLPVFHSFGLTVGLVLPLVSGVMIYLYPSPLHYRIIPELIYRSNATILFGTDTFLAGYARTAHAYDFRSVRYIMAGGEPVKASTRRTYSERFGIRILEGYGVTEMAPALALNTPMFNREGTVGRLLPGIEARLDPVAGVEEGGRLVVRGPNLMLGYLRADNPGTLEPPVDGWHDTGDIVALDKDGFVTIKGRAKRFAKVGGEMISLAAVEALVNDLWPDRPSAAAILPDPRKGERIVLVTERADATRTALLAFARGRGASEMMVPAEVIVVAALPLLGSGKVDHPAVARMLAALPAQPSKSAG